MLVRRPAITPHYPPNKNPSLDILPVQPRTPRMTSALLSNGGPPLDDDDTHTPPWGKNGIGTYFQPGVVSPLFQWGAKILDEAVAWCVGACGPPGHVDRTYYRYLDAHVRGGYTFLMQNYQPGDKICIFGKTLD